MRETGHPSPVLLVILAVTMLLAVAYYLQPVLTGDADPSVSPVDIPFVAAPEEPTPVPTPWVAPANPRDPFTRRLAPVAEATPTPTPAANPFLASGTTTG